VPWREEGVGFVTYTHGLGGPCYGRKSSGTVPGFFPREHLTDVRREHLKRTLPVNERRELLKDLRLAPAWMHPIFRELAGEDA